MKKNLLKLLTLSIFAITTFTFTSCDPDPCKDVTCAATGFCLEGTCTCDDGYSGTDCSILLRSAYIGTYNASEVCDSDLTFTDNYTAEVKNSAEGNQYVILTNIYNFGAQGVSPDDASVRAEVSDSGLIIPTQNLTATNLTAFQISGTGTVLNGTSFTVTYTILDTSNNSSDSCTTTYTAQ